MNIVTGWGWQIFLSFPLTISLDHTHPVFSNHMFQILLYAVLPQFLRLTFLLFPSYFKLHNLTCLDVDVSTDDMTIPLQTALSYHVFNLHNNTYPIPKNISCHLIDQYHPKHHPGCSALFSIINPKVNPAS